ncbi:hypothetical protein FK529_05505 [Tsukamurella asaccharolytica]|uniref:Uncharacterized protein n=1 Tax=Tsukamurella asaccharolytica TaxID=2592067 RepID=A0A5C5RF95_9ACTN|nr:hypothetical protein [Tsukamurella asaccharolytica]TWS20781.1 hypothetical protein FK529_05505 [Tsukamurella asaccharolytica]
MAKIRDDFEGAVWLPDGTTLVAGDTVPRGATVGEHLLAETKAPAKSKAGTKDPGKPETGTPATGDPGTGDGADGDPAGTKDGDGAGEAAGQ